MKKKTIIGALLSLATMTLFGCGGGGGGSSTPAAGSTNISGVAAKGPISGGAVKVYNITNGAVDRTAEIGSGTSDGSGNYTISIPADKKPAGPVLVEVTGGTYTDEASGTTVTLKTPLQAAVSSIADLDQIAITPFTHLAVKQVEGIGTFSEQEINDANLQIGTFFEVEDIIHHQPFDSTKDAPAGVSDDQKKYSGALGVFSQMVNKRKGAGQSLDDALVSVLAELETELHDNGGFTTTTRDDFNTAIDDFTTSGKNKGGTLPAKVVFTGGVLQLKTSGSLPANTLIEGIDITIAIPDGVSFAFDAATGEAAAGVVAPSSKAANAGTISTAKFDATARTLHIILINVKPGIDIGEFVHVEFTGAPPIASAFAVTVTPVNGIVGGSTTDTNASPVDLTNSGITITQTVAGL